MNSTKFIDIEKILKETSFELRAGRREREMGRERKRSIQMMFAEKGTIFRACVPNNYYKLSSKGCKLSGSFSEQIK